jgi:hypothetical protein
MAHQDGFIADLKSFDFGAQKISMRETGCGYEAPFAGGIKPPCPLSIVGRGLQLPDPGCACLGPSPASFRLEHCSQPPLRLRQFLGKKEKGFFLF